MSINRLDITLDELRPLVLEAFKDSNQYLGICNSVANIAVKKGLVPKPNYSGGYALSSFDQDRVREIIWYLIFERVVTIGMNSSNPDWPWLKLTKYGEKVVSSSLPTPHDPSGYLDRLMQEVPKVDPVIITYLQESLNTYNISALLSSTITLGCASEKALLLLIESFASALVDVNRRQKFINSIKGKFIKRQFEIFKQNLNGVKGVLPDQINDGLDTVLVGIFEMIRNNRNDAGHPTGKSVSREQVYANLQVFIPYCKKVYQLIDFFTINPIS